MNVLEEAIIFAVRAHQGQTRKLAGKPYILHPLEVAAIISTLTDDLETMAAGVLHDTVEDCDVNPLTIREKFGSRVFALVQAETEDRQGGRSEEDSWMDRKEESLLMLANTRDIEVKKLWLGDKLSNIRSFAREHRKHGDEIWKHLHQKDPAMQRWYYETIAGLLEELSDTDAYREYVSLVAEIFGSADRGAERD